MLMQPKIEIKNLQKSYTDRKKNSKVVLYQLNLSVYPGEFLVLLGESGCGKTSLLKVLAGIEDYDFGDIYFDGVDALELEQADKNMSLVSQNYVLFPSKTVYENIDVPLANLKWNKKARINRILELSKMLGLDLILSRRPKELSGGQCQKVAIARSLAKNPDICLFDEPLSAIDHAYHDEIIKLLLDIHKKTFATYIYSTHNQKEAFILGDRVAIMNNMKIEQIGSKEEILNNPASSFVCSFLKDIFVGPFNGHIENGYFIFDDSNDFRLLLGKNGKRIKSKNTAKIFIKRDAFSLSEAGKTFEIKKHNPNSVDIDFFGENVTIEVDEDFDSDSIKLNIEADKCYYFPSTR